MNDKLEAILISIGCGGLCYVLTLGVVLLIIFSTSDQLYSENECKELKGIMKENPENENYLKAFPEKANQLRSDNCLEGIEYYENNSNLLIVIFPLFGFLFCFSYMLKIFYPTKGDLILEQNSKSIFCDCGKHLYDEDSTSQNSKSVEGKN